MIVAVLLALLSPSQSELQYDPVDVAIVGAGISGLNAARLLTDSALTVQVFESASRVGGRVWTLPADAQQVAIDVGPSWIHSSNKNPLTNLALANNCTLLPSRSTNMNVYYGDGRLVPRQVLKQAYLKVAAYEEEDQPQLPPGASYFMGLEGLIDRDAANLSEDQIAALQAIVYGDVVADYNMPLEDLLWDDLVGDQYENMTTSFWASGGNAQGKDLRILEGYQCIFDAISPPEDQKRVKLEHTVSSITSLKPGHAQLRGKTAAAEPWTITARAVIVAVSVGALKAGLIEFNPAPPQSKLNAWAAMRLGRALRGVIMFDERHWPSEVEFL